jgi:hypothetical protein
MTSLFLVIEMTSFWGNGTGGGGGADLDQLTSKDADGFPDLRARHVLGVLREASRRIEEWNWPIMLGYWPGEANITELLFGGVGPRALPGCLQFDDLSRHPDLKRSEWKAGSTRAIASTAIEHGPRVAKEWSLRRIETAVPTLLGGAIRWRQEERSMRAETAIEHDRMADALAIENGEPRWHRHIREALLEAPAFGGKRTRGFGRARLQAISIGAQQGVTP